MRTAAICPTCATYENALCIVYNGPYLSNIDVAPLENMQAILAKINTKLIPLYSNVAPTSSAVYPGQLYVNSTNNTLYVAKSAGTGASDWQLIVTIPATGASEYANNAAALFAGLSVGQVYRTGDLLKIVH